MILKFLNYIANMFRRPVTMVWKQTSGIGIGDLYALITDANGDPLAPDSIVFHGNTQFSNGDLNAWIVNDTPNHEMLSMGMAQGAAAISASGGNVEGKLTVYWGKAKFADYSVTLNDGQTVQFLQVKFSGIPTKSIAEFGTIEKFLEAYGYAIPE